MPRYRVTLTRQDTIIVEASNQYDAAIRAAGDGTGIEIIAVAPGVGRPATSTGTRKTGATKTKKAAKKRRPLSPEARAKLAQNLVKARAARAAKREGVNKVTKKTAASRAKKRATSRKK